MLASGHWAEGTYVLCRGYILRWAHGQRGHSVMIIFSRFGGGQGEFWRILANFVQLFFVQLSEPWAAFAKIRQNSPKFVTFSLVTYNVF